MKVLARGSVRVYDVRGEYQLQVQALEPLGKGSLQQAFEELKEKLGREGLFDAQRKRPLPVLPRRIGVVTSPTGAVIRDILRVLAVALCEPLGPRLPGPRPGRGCRRRGGPRHRRAQSPRATSMSSSWLGAAAPSRTCGPSTKRSWPGPSSPHASRPSRPWATRPISPSPTSSPTCVLRRPPRQPSVWSRPRPSFRIASSSVAERLISATRLRAGGVSPPTAGRLRCAGLRSRARASSHPRSVDRRARPAAGRGTSHRLRACRGDACVTLPSGSMRSGSSGSSKPDANGSLA